MDDHDDNRTPVDDVRRIREAIDAEFGGDIRKIAAHANAVGEALREKLGLKRIAPPKRVERDGKAG